MKEEIEEEKRENEGAEIVESVEWFRKRERWREKFIVVGSMTDCGRT